MKHIITLLRSLVIACLFFSVSLFAGQTGKIAGYVKDAQTGEPLIGVNVVIQGTYLGAVTDLDGYFYVNNIPPGKYTVLVSLVGYQKITVNDVVVKVDLTTALDLELSSESVAMGEVVITATRPLVQKDLTSSSVTVSNEEMKVLPVENIQQVINLQAGVIAGHFRGGRSNEVSYLVDGIPVTDVFNNSISLQVENSSVRELEIISGTFNAEYGQAMSGIVNIVTKEGSNSTYEGSVTAFLGSYYTNNETLFPNLNRFSTDGPKDLQLSLSGPTKLIDGLTFFMTGRYYEDDGYFYGKRIYNITDLNPYMPTGGGEDVAMSPYRKISLNGKLAYSIPSWKFSYSIFYDDSKSQGYDHAFRWAPDGRVSNYNDNVIHNVQISYLPTNDIFTTLKFSYNKYNYYGYLYEDPYDPRYVNPNRGIPVSGYTFRFGGNQGYRYDRYTTTLIGQWFFESQLSKEHKIKFGVEGRSHEIYNHGMTIVNLTEGQVDDFGNEIFTLGYRNLHSPDNQSYSKRPLELAAFVQDKMEYDIMIINAGVRLDYFNANTNMPTDLRNPSRTNFNPNFPGGGVYKDVDAKFQVSPRLGVSFPITADGAIHFSYGHFFQMPSFENLFVNDEYLINQGSSLSSITGNPDLKPQKTVKYELGLQQVIFPNISLYVTAYYSDITNLLGMEIINTYDGFKYARFINKDYGNVKGFILTLDKRFADFFSAKIDYTYQVAEGNSSDPYAVYNDNQSDPPVESEKKVVALDWDQSSTLSITGTVGEPGDWTVGLIFSYGSGMPYTEDIRISNGVRFENGGRKPTTMNLDLKADKIFNVLGFNVYATLWIYNVLDIRNEYGVYATTGRANSDLNTKYAGEIIGLNTIQDFVNNPGMYSSPRQVRFGVSVQF